MNYYFAPMEGVTTHIFRQEHARMFSGADRYYAPFLTACGEHGFKMSELKDLLPENNPGLTLVPQLLSNDAAAFLAAARQLRGMGFAEVNLNLGCPSGTVVAKKRGAGFLAVPEELDAFLDTVFSGADIAVSVKTRTGVKSPEEFGRILEIYNKYPIRELIIHPRVRADLYKNTPDLGVFAAACEKSESPLCYNGDIFTVRDCEDIISRFPALPAVMLGRGAVANPALFRECTGGAPLSAEELREFLARLMAAYRAEYSGDRAVLHRMKELWYYMGSLFPDSARQRKRILKSQTCSDCALAADALFRECAFDPEAGFHGQENSDGF